MPVAVARFSESTSAHIGMRTQTSAIACAAAVRPGPSLPISNAIRFRSGGRARLRTSRIRWKIDRVSARRQCDDREPCAPQGGQIARPVLHARVRRAQHAAHRRSNRLAVQRVAARLAQEHARAERRGIAERAADVVCIGNPFEHQQKIRPAHNLVRRASDRALCERQAAAVQVEAGDGGEFVCIADVDGDVLEAGATATPRARGTTHRSRAATPRDDRPRGAAPRQSVLRRRSGSGGGVILRRTCSDNPQGGDRRTDRPELLACTHLEPQIRESLWAGQHSGSVSRSGQYRCFGRRCPRSEAHFSTLSISCFTKPATSYLRRSAAS